MWIDKDGKIHERGRKWYSLTKTLEIYREGGHVVLNLETRDEYGKKVITRPA